MLIHIQIQIQIRSHISISTSMCICICRQGRHNIRNGIVWVQKKPQHMHMYSLHQKNRIVKKKSATTKIEFESANYLQNHPKSFKLVSGRIVSVDKLLAEGALLHESKSKRDLKEKCNSCQHASSLTQHLSKIYGASRKWKTKYEGHRIQKDIAHRQQSDFVFDVCPGAVTISQQTAGSASPDWKYEGDSCPDSMFMPMMNEIACNPNPHREGDEGIGHAEQLRSNVSGWHFERSHFV